MVQDILRELPYSQVVEFCNLPSALFNPKRDSSSDIDLLNYLVRCVGGHTTWDNIIYSKIHDKSIIESLRVAIEARMDGHTLTEECDTQLNDAWEKLFTEIEDKEEEVKNTLKTIKIEAKEAFLYAQEILNDINSLHVKKLIPESFESLNNLQTILYSINRYQSDSKDLAIIAEDEIRANQENLYEISEKAFERLFNLLKQGSFIDNQHYSHVFKQIPELILNNNINILKQIADNSINITEILIDRDPVSIVRKFRASRASRKMARISKINDYNAKEISGHKLSAYSSSIYSTAPALELTSFTHDGIEAARREADNITSLNQRSLFWLGIAKSCTKADLKNVALGEGLLAAGMDLIAKGHFLNARLTLVDAFTNLITSHNLCLDSEVRCVFALLSSVVWPQNISKQVANGDGTIWIEQPESMFELFRKGKFLSSVAKIWVTYLQNDFAAESFLKVVSLYLGDDKQLYKILCSQLLTSQNLLNDSGLVVRRLGRLLEDASPPASLLGIFQKISDEIPAESIANISKINGFILKKLANDLILQLDGLPRDNVAPVYETRLFLLELLDNIINKSEFKGKGLSEASLIVEPMVTEFYPEEKTYELEFPVVIRNSENADIASDVILSISCKESGKWSPTIDNARIEFGDIQPGQSKEKIFYIDIPDKIVGEKTEIDFQAQLRLGNVIPNKSAKNISVKIRPSTQRRYKSSPYTPGGAVSGTNFIGREREIAHIKSTLSGDSDQKVLLLYGIRRIGKTSILKNIQEDPDIKKNYYPVFWDVQDFGEDASTAFFVQTLIDKLLDILPDKYKASLHFSRQQIKDLPLYAMENFFHSLDSINLPKRILLMIDEVDRLLQLASRSTEFINTEEITDHQNRLKPEVIAALRKSTMVNNNIYIIFSGLPDIVEQEYQSRLFGLADDIEVKPLSESESIKIIQAGNSITKINKFIQNKLLSASGNQPYLLQVLCNKLFNRMKNSGRDMVANFDLVEVIEDIASKESIFTDYNSLMTDGWDILYGLALAQKNAIRSRKYVSSLEVEEALARAGIEYSRNEIEDVLKSYLVGQSKRPLVTRDPHDSRRFGMVVGLIGDFLIRRGNRV